MTKPISFPLHRRSHDSAAAALGVGMLLNAGEGLKTFYRDYCLASDGQCEQAACGAMQLSSIACTHPETDALPSILQCVAPCKGGFVGVDPARGEAQFLAASGMVTPLSVPGSQPVSSLHHAHGITHMLARNGETLWIAQGTGPAERTVPLAEGVGAGGTLLRADENGATIFTPGAKTIVELGPDWTITKKKRLNSHYPLSAAASFVDGYVLLERQDGGHGGGGLLHFPPEGPAVRIAGGFRSAWHVSPFEQGLLVCDHCGLHILLMDGLRVERSACMPWEPLARHIGHPKGVGAEALLRGEDLYIVFRLNLPLTPQSRSYCVMRAQLAQPPDIADS